MRKAFAIAGYGDDVLEEKFGGMLRALQYGAPPHGGIAPGIDRIVMLLCGEENLREVTLFPMNQRAEDLMMGAPSEVTPKQLRELHIRVVAAGVASASPGLLRRDRRPHAAALRRSLLRAAAPDRARALHRRRSAPGRARAPGRGRGGSRLGRERRCRGFARNVDAEKLGQRVGRVLRGRRDRRNRRSASAASA